MTSPPDYAQFLARKRHYGSLSGFAPLWLPDWLFDFQLFAADWSIRMGRSALLLDCGMGKTPLLLVWAVNVARKTGRRVLILTPLAVGKQTIAEAHKFAIGAERSQDGRLGEQLVVTNYERLHYFRPQDFGGVVCDESSILKNFDGTRKAAITEFMRCVPYRLLCTATAAPNDYIELGTSSEALGEMGHMDMLSRYFKNDQNTCDTRLLHRHVGGPRHNGWRFKGHAEMAFWRFVCGWARAARKPSDLGPSFDDSRFVLKALIEKEHVVDTSTLAPGMLFACPASNNREEREERRRTIRERCGMAASLVADTGQPAVVWCHLNDEGDLLERLIPDGQQIAGRTPDDEKEELFSAFGSGQLRVLIIKDKIGAWGLNWQHCNHVVRFETHSFESDYQAVRRCWRYGQTRDVIVDRIRTEGEALIAENRQRKSIRASRMFSALVDHMHDAVAIPTDRYEKAVEVPTWL
jgi:hypothetical protein